MRVVFLSDGWTVVLCFAVWPVLQLAAAIVCLHIPDYFYSTEAPLFRTRRFEQDGMLYDRLFRVSRWKHLIPDGGRALNKHGFGKKKLSDFSEETLRRFLIESARAELTHWLAIFPFWVFWFFTPPTVPWLMLGYALVVNLPCIVVQRYNRPRVKRFIDYRARRETVTVTDY